MQKQNIVEAKIASKYQKYVVYFLIFIYNVYAGICCIPIKPN